MLVLSDYIHSAASYQKMSLRNLLLPVLFIYYTLYFNVFILYNSITSCVSTLPVFSHTFIPSKYKKGEVENVRRKVAAAAVSVASPASGTHADNDTPVTQIAAGNDNSCFSDRC